MSLKEFDATSGVATDTAQPPAAQIVTFDHIPLDLIVTSETNPRTSFDQVKLRELADSIAALDVHQPILVRPIPAQRLADTAFATDASQLLLNDWPHKKSGKFPRPTHEIVSGERRYRASIMAGKRDIPAMIRQMSDQQVLEAQLVENLQRDDLHPMEEAEGYRRLCETTGITKESVGAKIGKSRSYVYQRLHLLALGPETREAFKAGKLDTSKALLVAGVADPKLQLKALKELTDPRYSTTPMSVRDFRHWLQQNVMLKLESAPFDTQDMMLHETAGACGTCEKRTGANRDIFAEFDGPDMCTDAKCYGQKSTISLQRIKDAAAEKGMKVIAGVEAKKAKPYSYGDEIRGYTRLDAKVDGGTLAKVLGKDAPTPMLFVDPHTQKQIKVLPDAVVGELLKTKGVETAQTKRAEQNKKWEEDQRKRNLEARIEMTWRARAAGQIVNQVRAGKVAAFSGPVLRMLLQDQLDTIVDGYESGERFDALLPLWGLPADEEANPADAILRHVQAADELELGPMLIGLLLSGDVEYRAGFRPAEGGSRTPAIDLLAQEAGVDVDAIVAAVKSEIKAEEAAERKAARAEAAAKKPAKASGATPLAAQAQEGAEGDPPAAPAGGKKARGKAAKLSTEEAKSGIAEAMQGHDGPGGETSAITFGIDDKVRFKQDLKSAGGKLRKVSGREGTIAAKVGDRAFSVRFGEKAHEVATADYAELELLERASNLALQAWPFPKSATAS